MFFPAGQHWQTWSHTRMDVCQCYLSPLVAANDGWCELLINILFTFLFNWTFWCFKIFYDKIAEFTGTMSCVSGWYQFWKRGVFFLLVRISVWIDLGGGVPEIDLPGSWDSALSECLSGSGNWTIISSLEFVANTATNHIFTAFYFCFVLFSQIFVHF